MVSEEILTMLNNQREELAAEATKLNEKREQLKLLKAEIERQKALPWYYFKTTTRADFIPALEQYNKERLAYEEKLKAYNKQVKAINALYDDHSEVKSGSTGEATPVAPAVKAVTVEVPATEGTIQEVVSNPRPKQVVIPKPMPKKAPTIVISDDNMGELEDNLELNDALIDDALELNDTPVVGVGDAGVSYSGTVYRMPKEMASTVDLIKQSGGTGTLHKRVKYQGEDGSKALIRKGNWRKNQYKVTEKDGSSYTTDDLQKFLQHLAAIEETAES